MLHHKPETKRDKKDGVHGHEEGYKFKQISDLHVTIGLLSGGGYEMIAPSNENRILFVLRGEGLVVRGTGDSHYLKERYLLEIPAGETVTIKEAQIEYLMVKAGV